MKRKPMYPRKTVVIVTRKAGAEESHMMNAPSDEAVEQKKSSLIEAGFHITKVLDYRKEGQR